MSEAMPAARRPTPSCTARARRRGRGGLRGQQQGHGDAEDASGHHDGEHRDEAPRDRWGTKASRKATLVMGTRNLLLLLQSKISGFAPTQVEGKSLKVVALAGPQSFWAGSSGTQRLLVRMRLKGGSPPRSRSARRWTSSAS
jgi:hypothetical protein